MSKTKNNDAEIAEAKAAGQAAKAAKAAKAEAAAAGGGAKVKQAKPSVVRLRDKYKADVIPALQKEFGYKNVMAVPKVT